MVTESNYHKVKAEEINTNHCRLTVVCDVPDALKKQKQSKAVGYDRTVMEALMCGGLRLNMHICILFNLFVKHVYLPVECVMQCLVKCKSGGLSDLNYYCTTAISTSFSKLFECATASHFVPADGCDISIRI